MRISLVVSRCGNHYWVIIWLLGIFLWFGVVSSCPAFVSDRPFNNAANWGGTGLMEIPTARILEDAELRVGFSISDPYRWYTAGMGIFPGLEVSGGVVELRDVPGQFFANFKDRSFDIKYQIFPESRIFPAVAVGVFDLMGTRVFPAEYLVFSRQFYPFDLTFGIGHNRLAGGPSLPFLDQFGIFGGVEVALHPRLNIIAEYNPIRYEEDDFKAVPEGARFPVNFGVRYKMFPGVDLGVSYQRGDTLSVMLHLQAALGTPVFPQNPDPPSLVPVDRRPFGERDAKEMVRSIHEAVQRAGFHDVSVYTDGEEIVAEFGNDQYLRDQKAAGRVLRILLFHAPPDARRITAVVRRRDMAMARISVRPKDFEKFIFGEIPERIFEKLAEVRVAESAVRDPEAFIGTERSRGDRLGYGVKPEIETYLLDEKDYVQVRVGVKPWAVMSLWQGASLYARYDVPFYSNIESSVTPPPDAVRSDIAEYLGRSYTFERLMVDQALRLGDRTFARISAGYLEKMYAGVSGEILSYLGEGKLALGLEADYALKREPGAQFDLTGQKNYTVLGNAYYSYPKMGLSANAKFGRFLYGDYGVRFEVTREYDTGVIIGAWYSFTDSEKFTGFNKGYNDKGIFLTLPLRLFLTHDSPTRYTYSISPWTRDVAATIYHWQPLFWLTKSLMPAEFKTKLDKMKK
jgi:opacity protein-like surface antigen